MAEVQDPSQAASEPSMEEILASIRKIISDDAPAETAAPAAEEPVELTQVIEDDGSVVAAAPEPAPAPVYPPPSTAASCCSGSPACRGCPDF